MKKKVLIILVFVIAVISLFTFKVVLNSRENDKTKIVDKKEKDKNENIINNIETNNKDITNNDDINNNTNKNDMEINTPSDNDVIIKKEEKPISKPEQTKPTIKTEQPKIETSKCTSKKFAVSWFVADFKTEQECVILGEKYSYDYSYACSSMQDECGQIWYMLRLRDRDGKYVNYKTIQ